jgi:hypothetical protein
MAYNTSKNNNKKIANTSFENVANLKYFPATVRNPNLIHEEIKNRLSSGNGCHYLVQNFLSPSLLSKNVKIQI